jgi:hypothetical protein
LRHDRFMDGCKHCLWSKYLHSSRLLVLQLSSWLLDSSYVEGIT